jgi:hypothetical protein
MGDGAGKQGREDNRGDGERGSKWEAERGKTNGEGMRSAQETERVGEREEAKEDEGGGVLYMFLQGKVSRRE